MRENWISRALTWIGCLIVGVVFGTATTIGHASALGWFPAGMVFGAIACAAILVAVRSLTRSRWAALATGIGMIAAVLLLSGRGPGGSVLVPDDLAGRIWGYLVAGAVLLVVAWPDLSRLPRVVEAPAGAEPGGALGADDSVRT